MPDYYYQPTTSGDPKSGPRRAGIFLIIIGLSICLFTLSGCVTQKRCSEKFPPEVKEVHTHTIETVRKDSILQGATITNVIYRDSLVMMPVNQWKVIRDTSGLAELRFYKDAYGNIVAQCQATDRMVEQLRQVIRDSSNSHTTAVKVEQRTPWYLAPLIWIGGGTLLFLLLRFGSATFNQWIRS